MEGSQGRAQTQSPAISFSGGVILGLLRQNHAEIATGISRARVLLQQRPIDCLRTSPVAGLFQSARFVEECPLVRRRRNKRKTSSERIPTHHRPKALGGAPPRAAAGPLAGSG